MRIVNYHGVQLHEFRVGLTGDSSQFRCFSHCRLVGATGESNGRLVLVSQQIGKPR